MVRYRAVARRPGDRVVRLQDGAREGALGHRGPGGRRPAGPEAQAARQRRRGNGHRRRRPPPADLDRGRRRSQRLRHRPRAVERPRVSHAGPARGLQPGRAAGRDRPRAGPREEPRRAPDDHAGGLGGGRGRDARRRHAGAAGWHQGGRERRGGLARRQEGRRRCAPPHPARGVDRFLDPGATHHPATRHRREPQARVLGRRDERPVYAQPARPRERPAEDRERRRAHREDQAWCRSLVHRGPFGAAVHGPRGLRRRPHREPSPDGEADRYSARDGLRADQERRRRRLVTGWLGRRGLRTIHEFRTRLARYHFQQRGLAKAALATAPAVQAAMIRHAREHGLTEADVRRRVDRYIDEIVPQLNVLSYYKIGYNFAKIILNLLYRVTVDYQDEAALERIPKQDVVVYLMNHRSNVDYVVLAYVLAYGAHVSYAVGEWARVWPLEYVFKSFGSCFVRRGFREPLYHAVLERYVHLITKNRVTQGFFPEGRLSRDGRLAPPKLGLLGYVCRTLLDPPLP